MASTKAIFRRGVLTGAVGSFVVGLTGYTAIRRDKIDVEYEEKDPEKINNINRGKEILKYGAPMRSADILYYKNHVLCYEQAKKIPLWAAEHITLRHLQGQADRHFSKFKQDPVLLEMYKSSNKDFLGSGWSRGHMAPAGDNKFDQKAMDETFYLSNIVPQNFQNNAGFWNRFEIYCRELTKKFKDVRVISGPLTLSNVEEGGKKFVMYELIGKSEVTVPTHLYKVILAENEGQPPMLVGFVVPNEPIDSKRQLLEYKVPVEYIEEKSGLLMLPKLDRSKTIDLCSVDACKLMDYEKFELYYIGRRMAGAKTLEALDKAWREIDRKKLKPDEQSKSIYKFRKEELLLKLANVEKNSKK